MSIGSLIVNIIYTNTFKIRLYIKYTIYKYTIIHQIYTSNINNINIQLYFKIIIKSTIIQQVISNI